MQNQKLHIRHTLTITDLAQNDREPGRTKVSARANSGQSDNPLWRVIVGDRQTDRRTR